MTPSLTVKGQVTIPKPVRDFLGLSEGSRVQFEPLPDGRVALSSADTKPRRSKVSDPFDAMVGSATVSRPQRLTTAEVMKATRGVGWNKP
jgi:AbrB family looped-hinge helix DNA binding protein